MPIAIRTVRIGGLSKAELLARLKSAGVQLNALGHALFADPRFAPMRAGMQFPIERRTVAGLGFERGARWADLVASAATCGLGCCPLELGPHLRLQLLDQPEGFIGHPPSQHRAPPGSITIASEPLDDDDETPKGFYLRRVDGVPWLRGYRSTADHVWSPSDVLIFARRHARAGSP